MKKYKYVIIEDDDIDRIATNFYLKKYPFFVHQASFSESKAGLAYLKENKIDIVFMDIDMPELNGMDLQKKIRNTSIDTIFITSHPEYAIEGFEQNAFDYIIKPLNEQRFDKCIKRLKEYLDIKLKAKIFESSFKKGNILIKQGREYITVQPHQMVYLEALKDYTKIVLYDNSYSVIHGNLGSILKEENYRNFIRCHRSYAVQKNYISKIKTNEIILANNTILPLGQFYKEEIFTQLT